ncbi:diguanylate cyclase [Dechloromonas denitrificans]|uniref:Diguanylate cyclase n=1 Tax=Dechloromonas denitrificans TaxID=281362 RepID=A0A133XM22_9RHOO|nr:sensor domain-containing diguanylate cyclase [Dechloromonas denitrificans]KXB31997.1 diguanylate cyclase [Dechloromonas denitrificans]
MSLFNYLSLRQWLTLPYIALVFSVALLIGGLSYRTGSQTVDTVANHLLLETVARIGQAIDRHVVGSGAVLEAAFPNGMAAPDSIVGELDTLRTRFWIATSLHLDPNNYVYYGNLRGEFFGLWRFNGQDAELRIKRQAEKPRQIYRFSGINGALSAPDNEEKMFEPRARPWYKAGESNNSHTWTSIYIDFRNAELVATRARRVLDGQGDFQGVVATDLSLKRLNEFVRRLSVSINAVAFIIEPDGKLIASSRSPNIALQPDGTSARINAADSDSALQRAAYAEVQQHLATAPRIDSPINRRFDGPNNEAVELAFDRVRDDAGLDWIIAVAVPRSDFMQGVTANIQRAALIGLLAAVAAVMLGLGVLEWVGRDLRRLTRAAEEVGEGRLEVALDVQRNDEIGVLANTFREMQHRLRTDALTGLDNRDVMLRQIRRRIQCGRRAGDAKSFAVLFVDLNNFKLINDHFGHDAGDRTLLEISQRLRDATRSDDRVARYAGDEFVLMINNIPSREIAEQVRRQVEVALSQPLQTVDLSLLPAGMPTGGAVGMAFYPEDGDTAEQLIKHGDRDMYERKGRRLEKASA